jgi:hypothetical protein
MANLYIQGVKLIGFKNYTIITPNSIPPVTGDWRIRKAGIGVDSYVVHEQYNGTIWVEKSAITP